MRKIVILLMLMLATVVMADKSVATPNNRVKWAEDFKSGIEQATKENKPVLFVISRDTCKYCVLLENNTLRDAQVVKALNSDFVAIRAWTNENDYIPMEIRRSTPGLPGIWFLYPDGSPMYQPLLGYVKKGRFLEALGIVYAEFQKQSKSKGK